MAAKKKVKGKTRDAKPKATPKIPLNAMRIFAAEDAAKRSHQTVDGFDNFISRLGLNNDNALSAGTYEFNLVTRNRIKLEAAYRGSWVVGAVVDSVAEDMTRAGIEFSTNEDSKADPKDIMNAISKLSINQSLCSLEKWARLYGGSIGVLQIDGQDLATPLNIDSIGKDQFLGIIVFDRWMVNPSMDRTIKSGPEMGLPMYYDIVNNPSNVEPGDNKVTGQQKVHHSRVIRDIGIELPFFQAITEMMWGESILERMWDRLIAFDNATMSSASLIDRANLRTVGVDGLRDIIASGGEAQAGLVAMFDMMRSLQVNEGLTLLDKNDTFASTAYSFAGLSDMMLQFGQQLSGSSKIPLVRLFGQAPAGLGSTGESDIRMYYDNINAAQESKFRNPWQLILRVLWRSVYGRAAPKDLMMNFVPLWQMSAIDKANIAKTNTETIIGANGSDLVDRSTAMKELRDSSGDTGLFANITDEAIAEAEADADEPPMPDQENPKGVEELSIKPKPEEAKKATDSIKKWFDRKFGIKDADFKEGDHPRKDDGKFGSGGGGGKGKKSGSKSEKKDKPKSSVKAGTGVETSISEKISSEEMSALGQYAGFGHHEIKMVLNGKENKVREDKRDRVKEDIKNIDKVISKSTVEKDTKTYRGMYNVPEWASKGEAAVGQNFQDKGYVSTSTDPEIAKRFLSPGGNPKNPDKNAAMFEIKVNKGEKALDVSILKDPTGEKTGNEKELLLPRDKKYKVTAFRKENGIPIYTLETDNE